MATYGEDIVSLIAKWTGDVDDIISIPQLLISLHTGSKEITIRIEKRKKYILVVFPEYQVKMDISTPFDVLRLLLDRYYIRHFWNSHRTETCQAGVSCQMKLNNKLIDEICFTSRNNQGYIFSGVLVFQGFVKIFLNMYTKN